jgi:hypothetical protein
MSKRSAMLLAAIVTAVLAIGGLALSLGVTGPAPADAAPGPAERVVKVQHRTITVHHQADGGMGASFVAVGSSAGASEDGMDGSDDPFEDERDDAFEIEDHAESADFEDD